MVLYPLHTLTKGLGVDDVLIVTGGEHIGDFAEFLGDGSRYGTKLTYKVQERPGGIAEALALAEDFAHGEYVWVILGDNIFGKEKFTHIYETEEAMIFVCPVEDNRRFGVPYFSDAGDLEKIVEKPNDPPNDYAVSGLYRYPPSVFDIIRKQEPSARGELEITDVNNAFLENKELNYIFLPGFWSDCGTPDSLAKTTKWFLDNPEDSFL